MIQKPWHVAVLIPARNEEKLLPRCLRSVLAACAHLPVICTYDVVLVVNASTDQTCCIGERCLKNNGIVVNREEANVGGARALAAETALRRYHGPLQQCWLANTDADCDVPLTWLTDQLRHAERGIQAVAGIIDVDSFLEHAAHVSERFRLTYLLGSDGTHGHVHGANLGVRADSYKQVGGWTGLETAEDHDLWRRLSQHNSLLVSDAELCVLTSGRRIGRAPDGFADRLAAHNGIAS